MLGTWRKSSRSNSSGGACVELACGNDVRAVRDSKNPHGGVLLIGDRSAGAFLAAVKAGRLDR
ncbi:DUF397 domain-containing protein [Actinosynnema sp. NPDC059335]|uniref:DUF397 domain-containing protein n=1 Tax=Actinosynnema sp. NPDC059335 TaxID=3346804 RepID=UPI0036732215